MTEKYLVIQTDGKLRWEEIPRDYLLDRLHEIIGCSCVEQVRTIVTNIVMIVDESGRIKNPPQQHNALASTLYYGWITGMDDIVGPAVLAELRPVGPYQELDWFPLRPINLVLLSSLGFEIPEEE